MKTSEHYKTDEVTVDFAGSDAGTAPLTWGQREILVPMELAGRTFGLGGAMPIPPTTTVDEVATVLRFAMSRHQALRTRFDCDATGRPVRQIVGRVGTVSLDVFDVDDGTDTAEFATALRWEYEGRGFDYRDDWPVRMGVVRRRGQVTHAVVLYNHLVLDGYGLDALNRDLAHLDRATGAQLQPPAGTQPLEHASYQSSPEGLRQSEMALRYWTRHLRSIPARRSPRTPHEGPSGNAHPGDAVDQNRYRVASMRSPAAHLALAAISTRTRVGSSPVLLAAFAVQLARLSGVTPSVVRAVMSNRFRAGLAESVSVLNQSGLCVIDVADMTFDEVVNRAWRSSMGAGLHAYYDPHALHDLFETVGRERAEDLDMSCFFNDSRRTRIDVSAEVVTRADLAQALERSDFRWEVQRDNATERVFMNVNESPSTLEYSISADTWYWSPEDIEALVRGVESVLVEAALTPDLPTGVSSRPTSLVG